MRIRAGTSGFKYAAWKGTFYPAELADDGMLRHYSEQLPAVEINNTFYRMPSRELLERWAAETTADFRFVLKAPRRLTHIKRLKDPGDTLPYLLEVAGGLGDKLGPLLFQLPPNAKKDVPRLRDFLAWVPAGTRAAFEFRHASWLDDAVYDALREANASLCIADADDFEVPLVGTADWGYLRLRRASYDAESLASWAERVRGQRWDEAWVFFKHEDAGVGPALARRFLELG